MKTTKIKKSKTTRIMIEEFKNDLYPNDPNNSYFDYDYTNENIIREDIEDFIEEFDENYPKKCPRITLELARTIAREIFVFQPFPTYKGYDDDEHTYRISFTDVKNHVWNLFRKNPVSNDPRMIGFPMKEYKYGAYCFTLRRKQLWAYNGVDCPDAKTVQIIDW